MVESSIRKIHKSTSPSKAHLHINCSCSGSNTMHAVTLLTTDTRLVMCWHWHLCCESWYALTSSKIHYPDLTSHHLFANNDCKHCCNYYHVVSHAIYICIYWLLLHSLSHKYIKDKTPKSPTFHEAHERSYCLTHGSVSERKIIHHTPVPSDLILKEGRVIGGSFGVWCRGKRDSQWTGPGVKFKVGV